MYAIKSLSTPRAVLAITALTFIIGLAACKSAPPAPPTDDASLTAALQSRIAGDGALSNEPIQSAVQGGSPPSAGQSAATPPAPWPQQMPLRSQASRQ